VNEIEDAPQPGGPWQARAGGVLLLLSFLLLLLLISLLLLFNY
jgi:hypothetical protein